MCIVRTTGRLDKPKLFNFKLRLIRWTDHKNGAPSVARRPRLMGLMGQATKNCTHDYLVVHGIPETKPIFSTHFLPTVISRHGNVMKKVFNMQLNHFMVKT